jgi:hypothetical protein
MYPEHVEFPAYFSNEWQRFSGTAGNRSLLGPFNNIRSYFVLFQYQPDSLSHRIGILANTEKEGELIRWNRAQAQYSYAISLSKEWRWQIGASAGFYNLVLEGTNSTGSLSVWAFRRALASALQYKKHQVALVWQDIGSPRLYYGLRYLQYFQTAAEVLAYDRFRKKINLYYFNKISSEEWLHEAGWKLSLWNVLSVGHIMRFTKGNTFMIETAVPFGFAWSSRLQLLYNSPLFSKLNADFQSVELRLSIFQK